MSNERLQVGYLEVANRPIVNGTGVLLQGEAAAGGASSTAFNGNRQIKAVPVVQTNYGGTTISGFLENMFFPFISGTVSLNEFSIFTYGINSGISIQFNGNITLNENTITGIAYLSGNNILSGPSTRTLGGSYSTIPFINLGTVVRESTNEVYKTRIFLQRDGQPGIIDSTSRRIRFEPRYYFGASANPNLGINITGLTASTPNTYTYNFGSRPSNVTHSFSPNNQYIYFAYPSPASTQDNIINWGNNLTSIKDTITNFEYIGVYTNFGTVDINFPLKTLRYRIYRSNDLITLLPGESLSLQFSFP